ncbi:MAG: cob(I)yrinic acid a,c-diamide adenosyltransferase [Thermaerobacter sp.]|nr:cob(I)yrinic acid a,c-diamide adenosyltransferase [Thermaerobacter sp.]
MRIYTRLGDQGETSLYTPKGVPQRLHKSHARVEAYGTIDELNAQVGAVRAELPTDDPTQPILQFVQHRLFHAGYDISTMPQDGVAPQAIKPDDTACLESEIDRVQRELPQLRQFILPSGVRAAAMLQIARTVARRAERRVVSLREDPLNPEVVRFLNRLSDLLFVLARDVNLRLGQGEETVDWQV